MTGKRTNSIQFLNNAHRNQHPQACLIPQIVWSEIFSDNELPEFIIQWMSISYEALKKQVISVSQAKRDKAWMAIVYSHPDLTNQQLVELSGRLAFSLTELLNLLVMLGDGSNHLKLFKSLSQKEPYDLKNLYDAYALRIRRVAKSGHLNVLKHIAEMIGSKAFQDMVGIKSFSVFREAAEHGHLDVLRYLEEKAPDKLQDMIAAQNFYSFRWAAQHGHLDVLHYLEEKAPDKLQDMIATGSFCAFRFAATQGHLDVLKYLIEKVPANIHNMIMEENFLAFQLAALKGHFFVVEYLLNYSAVFTYAEVHHEEYGERYVSPFVRQKLTALRAQQQETEANNLDAVFDVASDEEAKILFYSARNLIRRNDIVLIDDLRFLLNIPSVKAMAHSAVTPNQPNELLRLAVSSNNEMAAQVLLHIPAVRILAEENNYYRREQQGRFDLAALAADCESSMTALTQGEQQRLQALPNVICHC